MRRDQPSDIAFVLPPEPDAAARARRLLRQQLAELVPEATRQELELLITELVANSVRHGGLGPRDHIRVHIRPTGRSLVVEVADAGPGFVARAATPRDDRTGGFGLYLLDHLATLWGVTQPPTRVWFELDFREHGPSEGAVPNGDQGRGVHSMPLDRGTGRAGEGTTVLRRTDQKGHSTR